MGRLDIPISDHNQIRRSAGVQAELRNIASEIADEAERRMGPWERDRRPSDESENDGPAYGTDLTVGSDRARAHVWPRTGAAVNAEARDAPLLQIVAERGAVVGE
jgi:hypothetical protein